MSYTIEPVNVTGERVIDPRSNKSKGGGASSFKWWLAQNDNELCTQLLSTTEYLKNTPYNVNRVKQASIYSKLFSGKPLFNFMAANSTLDSSSQMPIGRPTANVCYSCVDTLVSRVAQDPILPTFLSEGAHYKKRLLSKQANQFIAGEFFRVNANELQSLQARDALVVGNGFLKIFPKHDKVHVERVLETELLVDYNDGYYGKPRQLIQRKLVDRGVMQELFPKKELVVDGAQSGNVDTSPRSVQTVSDQFIVAEAWHLPSGPDADDGRHVIVCSAGVILDELYTRDKYPFVKLGYNKNIVGYFDQSLVEILMPTQMELYRMLIVASQGIELMGVPRILIDEMSKILETAFNNRIGGIIKYRGTPPTFIESKFDAFPAQYIDWLIQNSYRIAGISEMSAAGIKPGGLNSGEAQREFSKTQDTRYAAFVNSINQTRRELAYQIIDCASEIVEKTGKYSTVYPGKDGIEEVDFKAIKQLKDSFIIQCYDMSSLPKDPEGRQARLSEMLAAGEISLQEFRRLSHFPDLEQSDQLAVALEERILHDLDSIIEDGELKEPDPFILDPTDLAITLTVQYINKYSVTDISEEKLDLLRTYFTQIQDLKESAARQAAAQMAAQQQQMAPQGQAGGGLPVQPPQPSIAPQSNAQV